MASMKIQRHIRQAQKVMVGGVNSPVRAFKAVGGNPLMMERGQAVSFLTLTVMPIRIIAFPGGH